MSQLIDIMDTILKITHHTKNQENNHLSEKQQPIHANTDSSIILDKDF